MIYKSQAYALRIKTKSTTRLIKELIQPIGDDNKNWFCIVSQEAIKTVFVYILVRKRNCFEKIIHYPIPDQDAYRIYRKNNPTNHVPIC